MTRLEKAKATSLAWAQKRGPPILRKNQRPLSLTSREVQQLKRISHSLRKLNRAAHRELRRITYTDLTRTQYREAGEFCGTIAIIIIGALRFHHEYLKAEREQQTLRMVVHFVTPCIYHHHPESRQLTEHDNERKCGALKRDPAHLAEIESLLKLTNSIEELVLRRSTLRGVPLNTFFRRINHFRLAMLQQQQHLLDTTPQLIPLVELQFADRPDVCTDCLTSKEVEGTIEDDDRQV